MILDYLVKTQFFFFFFFKEPQSLSMMLGYR